MTVCANPPQTKPARPRGRPAGTVMNGLRKRAWISMRQLKEFKLNDLLSINANGTESDAASNLLKYLSHLERHGIITRLAQRAPGQAATSPGHVVWAMAHDLGWLAPFWKKKEGVLWDPNTSAVVDKPAPAAPTAPTGGQP